MSGAMVFAAATQGTSFDCLALMTMGACVPGSHRTVIIKKTVLGRPPFPGYCTDRKQTICILL